MHSLGFPGKVKSWKSFLGLRSSGRFRDAFNSWRSWRTWTLFRSDAACIARTMSGWASASFAPALLCTHRSPRCSCCYAE
eukprot:8838679-Pyramimonas_sp.AAC.1